MDLTHIKGLGPARGEKLDEAGIDSLDRLAGIDPAKISEATEIPEGVLEGFRGQARALVELLDLEGLTQADLEALVEADVRSVDDLTAMDASELSAAAGIDAERIEGWQTALGAGGGVGEAAIDLAENARQAGEIARDSLGEARVVLREGVSDAMVKFEQDVLAEARILPIKAKEDADERLEKLRGDVVVLREKADTALVRVGDEIAEGLPIFKEKVSEAGRSAAEGAQEVRVRVQEVRDKRVLPQADKIGEKIKGLFGRD